DADQQILVVAPVFFRAPPVDQAVAADRLVRTPAKHDAAVHERIVHAERTTNSCRTGHTATEPFALLVEFDRARADERDLGMLAEELALPGEAFRMRDVVAIENRD